MCNPSDFVQDQFSKRYWSEVPTILRTAYRSVDELVKDTPWLQIPSAEDNRGRLVSHAVDFGFSRAIERGAIACDFRWAPFAQPTGRYLELRFSHSTASISRVADPMRQPRNVVFRENARLRTQLVFDLPEMKDDLQVIGAPHFLIVHGYKSLDFAHIGVPASDSKSKYLWRSENLMNLAHKIPDERPPAEDTDVNLDELNLLKEDIERWRRNNGEE